MLILQGPNLNRLGRREPSLYGTKTLEDIHREIESFAREHAIDPLFFQSSHEGAIVDRIHQAEEQNVQGIVANLGAYTHTSIAIRDALLAVAIPVVEVHLSNVHRREPFRSTSMISDIAAGVISGLGPVVYRLAMIGLLETLPRRQ